MKFYVASSLSNVEQVRELSRLLKEAGWEHTYDWTARCPVREMDAQTLRSIAEKECEGVKRADVVIVLTPQGRGTHTEFGMAVALNKKVYLCHCDGTYFRCDENTSAFYWLSKVNWLVGDTEAIAGELLKTQNP